jgi:hypothetical protein
MFDLFRIKFREFFIYSASVLMTRIMGLNSWHELTFFFWVIFLFYHSILIFFLKISFMIFFGLYSIKLSYSYDLDSKFWGLTWDDSPLITQVICYYAISDWLRPSFFLFILFNFVISIFFSSYCYRIFFILIYLLLLAIFLLFNSIYYIILRL